MANNFTPEFEALALRRKEIRVAKARLKHDIVEMQNRVERLTGMVTMLTEQMQALVDAGKDMENDDVQD